jgi:hypothetical protein
MKVILLSAFFMRMNRLIDAWLSVIVYNQGADWLTSLVSFNVYCFIV